MINGEFIVDNFAGGGGASTGIEVATGYSVDIAINHDPEAIRMHKANHPNTKHHCESVWDVDPIKACEGHPVALAWFSPDCKHFSKAKGGKPKDKTIRGLAWVALRWAALVRPRVIMLENVEEFQTWGPLNRGHRPVKKKKGTTFTKFVLQLQELGYRVEYRELVAADYGAPTMRKRFFLIARCDGKPIVWPEPTHAPADSPEVAAGLCLPYAGACTQIDFSLPCPSIFDSAEEIKEKYGIRAVRPLAPKTMERIARGLKKFVLDNPDPFIVGVDAGVEEHYMVQIGQTGFVADRSKDVRDPLTTIVSKNEHCLVKSVLSPCIMCNNENNTGAGVEAPLPTITTGNRNFLVAPTLIQYHSETAKDEVRGQGVRDPIMTVDGSNRYGLVTSFLHKYYDGGYKGAGDDVKNPLPTVTAIDHNSVCAIKVWEGGLASHGGTLGIVIAIYFYSKRVTHKSMLWTFDKLVVPTGLVAAMIRLGNLMNHEVYGHPTDASWGFRFIENLHAWRMGAEPVFSVPSHPTQLYEAICYLLTFGICMWLYFKKEAWKKEGLIFGVFMICVFGSRFFIEFLKNNQEDFEAGMILNMGQLLSIPFVLAGCYFVWRALTKNKQN